MRIAILARACYPFHGQGGLERHVFDLVRHLIGRNIAVTLVTPPERRRSRGGVRQSGNDSEQAEREVFDDPRLRRRIVPYRTFPFAGRRGTTVIDRSTAYPFFGWRAGRVVADLVSGGEVDLVYGLGASALGYARARARGARAPLVFNPQGLEEFGATDAELAGAPLKRRAYAPLRAAVRICARAADRVIATDTVLEPVVLRHLAVPASRVRVVPNAVDVDRCDRLAGPEDGERIRTRHAIESQVPLLLSVGRLEANKGFHVLAEALGRLPNEAAWRWVLVGDGPFRRAIQRAIEAAGLQHRAILAGRVSDADLHAWYEAASLFVHPTLYEGSSLVTLEAMAHRRPVVATTAGGLPDKVTPGVTGWLVTPGDSGSLASAVREALHQPERRPVMGAEGRALALGRFSWPRVIDQFLGVCSELLEGNAAGSPQD